MMIPNSTDGYRSIIFTVPGEVRGQGRPRTQVVNGRDGRSYAHIYQSHKDSNTKHNIQLYAKEALDKAGYAMAHPSARGISVLVRIYMRMPNSFSQKKRNKALEDEIRPRKKPDLDNVLKSVLDAMTGVVYRDDKEVTAIQVVRHYYDSDRLAIQVSWNEEEKQK